MGQRVRETERKYEVPAEIELTDPAQLDELLDADGYSGVIGEE